MQWRAGGGGEGRSGKGMGLPLPTLQAPLMLRTWDMGACRLCANAKPFFKDLSIQGLWGYMGPRTNLHGYQRTTIYAIVKSFELYF